MTVSSMVPWASCREPLRSACWVETTTVAHPDRAVIFIFDRDLGLAVGPKPCDLLMAIVPLSHGGQPLRDAVRQDDRQRHAFRGLVGGVSEHHALVARALLLVALGIDAHGDVGRLPVDRGQHGAGPPIEAVGGVGVPDRLDGLANQVGNVHVGIGRDLAGDDRHAGGDQCFTGHPGGRIAGEDGVEDRVGDLIGDLVRVAFGDRLGGEDVTPGRGHVL